MSTSTMKHNHSLCAQVVRTDAAPRVADWRESVVTMYQAAREPEINTLRRTLAERLCASAACCSVAGVKM